MSRNTESEQPNRRSDGEQTHFIILDEAVRLASIEGVNQITLGRLAEKTGVSKSGVYAHFGSKERLQLEIVDAARQIFEREVITPGLSAPEGLGQLKGLCEAYLSYVEREVFPGGCFFAGLISEFDAQPGEIHELVVAGSREWEGLLRSRVVAAQSRGELKETLDPDHLVFELEAALELANYRYVLYRDPAIIGRGRTAVAAAIERSTP